jgi:hypothetical protein
MVIRGIIGEMGAVRARIGAETRARQVAGVVSPTGVIVSENRKSAVPREGVKSVSLSLSSVIYITRTRAGGEYSRLVPPHLTPAGSPLHPKPRAPPGHFLRWVSDTVQRGGTVVGSAPAPRRLAPSPDFLQNRTLGEWAVILTHELFKRVRRKSVANILQK